MAKKAHKGFPIVLLYLFSFLCSILPIGIVFAVNIGKYTRTLQDTVKLAFGGVVIVVFVVMKVLGKLKMPRRVVFFAMIFALSWLFAALLEDLILISGAALLGEAVDYIIFTPMINRRRENRQAEKVADKTAEAINRVLENYNVGGRV